MVSLRSVQHHSLLSFSLLLLFSCCHCWWWWWFRKMNEIPFITWLFGENEWWNLNDSTWRCWSHWTSFVDVDVQQHIDLPVRCVFITWSRQVEHLTTISTYYGSIHISGSARLKTNHRMERTAATTDDGHVVNVRSGQSVFVLLFRLIFFLFLSLQYLYVHY